MFHEMMEEWLKGEQRKILFPKYKEEDVFMLEEFVNYLDCMVRQAAEHGVHPTGLTVGQKEEVLQIVESAIKKGSA